MDYTRPSGNVVCIGTVVVQVNVRPISNATTSATAYARVKAAFNFTSFLDAISCSPIFPSFLFSSSLLLFLFRQHFVVGIMTRIFLRANMLRKQTS